MAHSLPMTTNRKGYVITIKAQGGTMHLNADDYPSNEDMTDIISSLTRSDDNGAEFQALCDHSTTFGRVTNANFLCDCEAWLEVYRKFQPLAK